MAYIHQPRLRMAMPKQRRDKELLDLELVIGRRISDYLALAPADRANFFLHNMLIKAKNCGKFIPRPEAAPAKQ